MMRIRRGPTGRRTTIALAAAAGLGLALLAPIAVQAEDNSAASSEGCPPGITEKQLQQAGDNFADACKLPEKTLSELRAGSAADGSVLPPNASASSGNLGLIANIPKQGAFAGETSYNSDLAFKGNYAFAGNYDGFMVYDISNPSEPKVVSQVVCPGSQNDVSVWRNFLVLSVDSSRSNDTCNNVPQSATIKESWEGVRVFDISNPATPQYVAAVETPCGSHTHSLAPSKDNATLYVYVSSYSPNAAYPDCQPPHDLISVVKVPTTNPGSASLVDSPVIFPDGGNPAGNTSRETSGCHDITTFPAKDIAAGACMGDGVMMDISDREHPKVTNSVRDLTNFAFWHSATFNNDASKVVFTDELGGGGAPTCNPEVGSTRGANGIYDLDKGKLKFRSYFKIPRPQSDTENCVAHNGSLIPVKGKDVMVQAWYQGGISVFDFTNSAKPKEVAWFDRGPIAADRLVLGGAWSTYYYNGYIYSNEIQRGFDVFDLRDKLTDKAKKVRMDVFNPQAQPSY